jgi:hypothetical protein
MRFAALCMLLLAGCAGPGCPPGLAPGLLAEAWFGRAIPGGSLVSDAAWAGFVDAELTPRFPDGLSVTELAGQWRGPDGAIVREPSRRVSVVLTEPARQRPLLAAAASAYRARFSQDSVLVTETATCFRF